MHFYRRISLQMNSLRDRPGAGARRRTHGVRPSAQNCAMRHRQQSSPRRVLDDQFILDSEGACDLTRAQTRDGLVGLAVHDPEQSDRSALHDDVKGVVAKRLHPWEAPKTHRVKAVVERVPMANTPPPGASRRNGSR